MIPSRTLAELAAEAEEIAKMLNGYIAFLKKSKRSANEPGANLSIGEDPSSYLKEPLLEDDAAL